MELLDNLKEKHSSLTECYILFLCWIHTWIQEKFVQEELWQKIRLRLQQRQRWYNICTTRQNRGVISVSVPIQLPTRVVRFSLASSADCTCLRLLSQMWASCRWFLACMSSQTLVHAGTRSPRGGQVVTQKAPRQPGTPHLNFLWPWNNSAVLNLWEFWRTSTLQGLCSMFLCNSLTQNFLYGR